MNIEQKLNFPIALQVIELEPRVLLTMPLLLLVFSDAIVAYVSSARHRPHAGN
jgi:hypothetical protein